MSGFWEVEGEKIQAASNIEVEGGGLNGLPIPAGTQVKVAIADVKWETSDDEGTYINIKHQVLQPLCYKGRVFFQKLHVRCHQFKDAKRNASLTPEKLIQKRAKALRMLAVIDTNAGGKLLQSPDMPTDAKLQQCLAGKTMAVTVEVWEIDTDKQGQKLPNPADWARGNWVKAVAPKEEFKDMTKEEQEAAVAKTDEQWKRMLENPAPRSGGGGGGGGAPAGGNAPAGGGNAMTDSFDDDIPFAPIGLQEGRNFLHMI